MRMRATRPAILPTGYSNEVAADRSLCRADALPLPFSLQEGDDWQ